MFKVFNKIKNLIGNLGILHVLVYAFSILQSIITVYFAITVKDLINSATNFKDVHDLILKCVICVSTVVISYVLSITVKLVSEKLKIYNNYGNSQKHLQSGKDRLVSNQKARHGKPHHTAHRNIHQNKGKCSRQNKR